MGGAGCIVRVRGARPWTWRPPGGGAALDEAPGTPGPLELPAVPLPARAASHDWSADAAATRPRRGLPGQAAPPTLPRGVSTAATGEQPAQPGLGGEVG